MKITQNSEYKPIPEGTHQAVLVDWIDYGYPQNEFKGEIKTPVPVVEFVFQIEEANDFGERLEIRSKRLNVTWNAKSNFPKVLASILGKKQMDTIIASGECDLDSFIGTNAWIEITHDVKVKDGQQRTYSNIVNYSPIVAKRDTPIEAENYTRMIERDGYAAPVPGVNDDNPTRQISSSPVLVKSNGETYVPPTWMVYAGALRDYETEPVVPPRPAQPQSRAATVPTEIAGTQTFEQSRRQHVKDLASGKAAAPMQRPTRPPVPAPAMDDDGGDLDDSVFDDEDDTPMTLDLGETNTAKAGAYGAL